MKRLTPAMTGFGALGGALAGGIYGRYRKARGEKERNYNVIKGSVGGALIGAGLGLGAALGIRGVRLRLRQHARQRANLRRLERKQREIMAAVKQQKAEQEEYYNRALQTIKSLKQEGRREQQLARMFDELFPIRRSGTFGHGA